MWPSPRLSAAFGLDRGVGRRRLLWGGALVGAVTLGALGLRLKAPLPVPKIEDYVQITSDRVEKAGPWFEAGPLTDGSRVYFNDLGNAGYEPDRLRGRLRRRRRLPGPCLFPPGLSSSTCLGMEPTCSSWSSTRGGSNRGELWVVPAVGGTPHRLGDLRANYAAWSPDGSSDRPDEQAGTCSSRTRTVPASARSGRAAGCSTPRPGLRTGRDSG